MRVVLDTNVIVSAYLGVSLDGILKAFIMGKFILIVSKPIVDEYFEVLIRPKFKIKRSGDNHLLDLKTLRGIPILTAREFLERL